MEASQVDNSNILLIDGSSFIYRAYHAMPDLTSPTGKPTGATRGIINMLKLMQKKYKTQYWGCVFDVPGKTFRDVLHPEYKATRAATPNDLIPQLEDIYAIIKAMGIPVIMQSGIEADDIIGTFSRQAKGIETIIVTGDKDELQLVDEHVKVYMLQKGFSQTQIYGLEEMMETYGLTPKEFIDLKALQGDSSDNIPGVPGVGPKTAVDLIQKYNSLDGVYENLDQLKGKLKERLEENKELAYLSYELSTIALDAPIKLDLEHATLNQVDRQALHDLFHEAEALINECRIELHQ